jgi:hypothetical protein
MKVELSTARAEGDHKKANRLIELLEAKSFVKALAVISGKPAATKKPPQVEAPRTMVDHLTKCQSEFFEACIKAKPGEVKIVESYYATWRAELEKLRQRIASKTGA